MKWIKVSERLPADNKPVIVKKNDGSVKWEMCVDSTWFQRQDVFCWLDETGNPTTTVAPPVSEEGVEDLQDQVRAHIKDHAFIHWDELLSNEEMIYLENLLLTFNPLCPPGSIGYNEQVRHIQKHSGANSVRQQGDVKEVKQSQLFRHVLEQCRAEELRVWRVMNEANKASGMGPIKKSSLLQLVENVLDNTESQSPSMPQAGFIEQLRASNPYTPARIGYKQRGAIWNECVDKATELLNSPKTPNNEPII